MAGPLVLFRKHWEDKLQPYKDAGILIPSGIRCPEDGNELFVLGKPSTGLVVDGQTPIIDQKFAICDDGHVHPL